MSIFLETVITTKEAFTLFFFLTGGPFSPHQVVHYIVSAVHHSRHTVMALCRNKLERGARRKAPKFGFLFFTTYLEENKRFSDLN